MKSSIQFRRIKVWSFAMICFLLPLWLEGQNLCISSTDSAGVCETCHHSTGQISTVRFWDHEKRWGYFEAFNTHIEQLVKYHIRNVGGHASAMATYHENGQVSKLEYSSAPDGGIQYEHIIHHYNAEGEETLKQDLSWPNSLPQLVFPKELLEEELLPAVVAPSQANKDAVRPIEIMLMNLTGRPQKLHITKVKEMTSREMVIHSGDDMRCIDTLYLKSTELSHQWVQFSLSRRGMKRYEVRRILDSEVSQLYAIIRKIKYEIP